MNVNIVSSDHQSSSYRRRDKVPSILINLMLDQLLLDIFGEIILFPNLNKCISIGMDNARYIELYNRKAFNLHFEDIFLKFNA